MSIKMAKAKDSAGQTWDAATYIKGKGTEPLKCFGCAVGVTHVTAHEKQLHEKAVVVPAFFRLMPGVLHLENCAFQVEKKIKVFADESEGLIESIKKGRYRLRLASLKDEFARGGDEGGKTSKVKGKQVATTSYQKSGSKLPAYLNSAKKVLVLRALCETDEDIEKHLELVFEGNAIIPWSMFYFGSDRYLEAYQLTRSSTVQYPIAIHGTVGAVKRDIQTKFGVKHILKLARPRTTPDDDDPENRIGIDVTIWSKNVDWVSNFEVDDEVVVLGLWKATPGKKEAASDPQKYRCATFQTHQLNLTLRLPLQVARVSLDGEA